MLNQRNRSHRFSWHIVFGSLIAAALAVASAEARFMGAEVDEVPVDRLIRNLEEELAGLRRDRGSPARMIEVRRTLARVHSIAYATAPETLRVRSDSGELFEFPGLGVLQALGESGPISVEGERHLQRAIELYEDAVSGDRYHIRTRLGYAWVLEQAGRRDEALEHYRVVAEGAWPVEFQQYFDADAELTLTLGIYAGSLTVFQEAALGALRYLDPEQDADEIESLESRLSRFDQLGRFVTPILIPLVDDASFDELVDPTAGVEFDLDGSGLQRRWGWITPKAAWLVWDPEQHGEIENGLQLFGSVGFFVFWDNGYQALAALDDDRDGRLAGAELQGLALWHDENNNGISDPGEVRPVAEHGLKSIATGHSTHQQGFPFNPAGVEMEDGSTRASYDWIVRAEPISTQIRS